MSSAYRIPDEPQPTAIVRLAVSPIWPFFATMFAGGWLAGPWWIVNALALGSVTRGREVAVAVASVVGAMAVALGLLTLGESGVLSESQLGYAAVCIPAWRLVLSYFLLDWQLRSFQLFEHFGGRVRTGLWVVVAGALLRPALAQRLNVAWLVAALT